MAEQQSLIESITAASDFLVRLRAKLAAFATSDDAKALLHFAVAIQPPERTPREQLTKTGRHDSLRAYLKAMARSGWYLDPSWAGGTEHFIVRILDESSPDEADDAICTLVEEGADNSLARLEADYPQRGRFFRSAFNAHRQGDYACSIPLMLAQADGMCRDRFGVQLQARVPGTQTTRLATVLGDETDPFRVYMSPLLEIHPVAFSEKERQALPHQIALNRHAVLHGESLDYDTRANSCRAMSYLRFVGWALARAKPDGH